MNIFNLWSSRGVRFKLLTGTLLSIIPMLIIVFVTYNYTRDLSLESSKNLLTLVDRYGSREINSYLTNQSAVFKSWTEEDIYGLAVEYNTVDELEGIFETMLRDAPGFSLLLLTDMIGNIVTARESSNLPRAGSVSLKGKTYANVDNFSSINSRSARLVPATLLELFGDPSPKTVLYTYPAKNSLGEINGLFLAFLDLFELILL